ncbi:hypothetical protein FQN50_007650 [Emmonsiellopsis sp. PD_5]|nr:hypothetical protein FQN50_007650 [Emmonsiellopsis sp. PD_5]
MASSSAPPKDGIKYVPFASPQKFSNILPQLYKHYQTCKEDTFAFEFLQITPDLKVVCQETTAETVRFNTPPDLEHALQESTVIESPKFSTGQAPRDDGWASWSDWVTRPLARRFGPELESQAGCMLLGPLVDGTVLYHLHRSPILGYNLYPHRPDHWVFTLRDYSLSKWRDSTTLCAKNYILRSEILTVLAIFWHQMNEIPWDCENYRDGKPVLRYQDGSLTATVITFLTSKVRVVQATCNPSKKLPTLTFTLRGLYDLDISCYNKDTAREIVKWILCPAGPQPDVSAMT